MNKVGAVLRELHEAEVELAQSFRAVAERQATDHGTHYTCRTLSAQCDEHAERLRALGGHYGVVLHPPKRPAVLTSAVDALRHKSSELAGRRPESGLLLLRDLRELYLKAQGVGLHWIVLGQAARALRDHDLLSEVSALHEETVTQAKWITTRIKEAAPQILVAG